MKATVEKVFPIKGRTDFFKYVIKDKREILLKKNMMKF